MEGEITNGLSCRRLSPRVVRPQAADPGDAEEAGSSQAGLPSFDDSVKIIGENLVAVGRSNNQSARGIEGESWA